MKETKSKSEITNKKYARTFNLFFENILVLDEKPYVIMVVGINGVGKTTTIGKLAHQFNKNNLLI